VPLQPVQFKRNVRDEAMGRKDSAENTDWNALALSAKAPLKTDALTAYKGAYE
jgi:hypothetical protein